VLEGAPGYCNRVMGAPAGPAEAQSTYSVLPEGKTFDDKFLFGIYAGDEMVGCADVIRDWPRPGTSIIGLLLIAEAHQGRGHGRAAYDELEKIIQGWGVRAAVVRNNDRRSEALPLRCGGLRGDHFREGNRFSMKQLSGSSLYSPNGPQST
jgi:GNAT superfamily N-acetyltransferase